VRDLFLRFGWLLFYSVALSLSYIARLRSNSIHGFEAIRQIFPLALSRLTGCGSWGDFRRTQETVKLVFNSLTVSNEGGDFRE
jgi:hypothetical protein